VVAAINLSGPDAIMDSPDNRERFKSMLLDSARMISVEMGFKA
jgi:IclR family pca regulon transcriptional regulator